MVEKVTYRQCRCGYPIVVLNTERGKKIVVNCEPTGEHEFRFVPVHRNETMYRYGTHQPHVATCTKKKEPKRKVYV